MKPSQKKLKQKTRFTRADVLREIALYLAWLVGCVGVALIGIWLVTL